MSEHNPADDLGATLDKVIDHNLNSKFFTNFGIIVEYDSSAATASIQPAPKVLHENGNNEFNEITQTIIHNVPVIWHGASNFIMHNSLKKDDKCLIIWLQNDINNYTGGIYNTEAYQMFSYNNAICLPIETVSDIKQLNGISMQNNAGTVYVNIDNNNNITIKNENGSYKLANNGEITLTTGGGGNVFKNDNSIVFANGAKITADGNFITAKGTDTDKHGHIGNLGSPTVGAVAGGTGVSNATPPSSTGEIDISPRTLKANNFKTATVNANNFFNTYQTHVHTTPQTGGGDTSPPK